MRIFPFKAIIPEMSIVPSPESFFSTIKERFREYMSSGFFKATKSKSFFIYKIESPVNTITGIIGSNAVQDIKEKKVLKHELTIAPKEQLMLQLIKHSKAMIKPVLLGFREQPELKSYLKSQVKNKPWLEIEFKESHEKHSLWKLSEKLDVEKVQKLFTGVDQAIIADGHHRCEAIVKIYDSIAPKSKDDGDLGMLVFYVPFTQLRIYDYYRVIDLKDTLSDIEFISRIAKWTKINKIEEPRFPQKKHELIMYINQEWFIVTWKKKVLTRYKKDLPLLDNSLFSELILRKTIGVTDIRNDTRMNYHSGKLSLEGIKKKTNRLPQAVAFLFHPVVMEELIETVQHGATLPPKSTWFEPRVKNGIIVKPYV